MENGRLAWRLVNDPRVPTWIKVGIPLLVVLYFLSPIDIIPDFLVGPGQLDDIGVILLGLTLIIRFAPQWVVNEHRQALGYETETGQGARTAGEADESYWRTPPGTSTGEPTRPMGSRGGRPIDAEYKVLPPEEGGTSRQS